MTEKEYPSRKQQLKNFLETSGKVIRNPRLVDDAEFKRRMEICTPCKHFDRTQVRCKKCGCMLKAKTRFKSASCPLHKW